MAPALHVFGFLKKSRFQDSCPEVPFVSDLTSDDFIGGLQTGQREPCRHEVQKDVGGFRQGPQGGERGIDDLQVIESERREIGHGKPSRVGGVRTCLRIQSI